jgi:hypothetical protein
MVRPQSVAFAHQSRSEHEADYIGLLLMAQACYDPREAVRLMTYKTYIVIAYSIYNIIFKYAQHLKMIHWDRLHFGSKCNSFKEVKAQSFFRPIRSRITASQ